MLSGWNYREKLTVDYTKIDTTLTDLQIVVFLNSGNFDFSKAKSDGTDIRFTSSDGDTLLPFERILHNSVSEIAFYQVKVSSISSTVDTDFYIYYGNSGASDGQDTSNTWTSEFISVWHLDESGNGTIGEYLDSTDNSHNGQGGGGDSGRVPSQIDSVVYKGQDFDQAQRDVITVPSHADFTLGTNDFLLSTNVKFESFPENYPQMISKDSDDPNHGFQFAYDNSSNNLYFGYSTDGTYATYTALSVAWTASTATQYNLAVRRDGTNLYFYVNGVQQGSAQSIGSASIYSGGTSRLMFSSYDTVTYTNGDLNGIQDEILFIKGDSKSASWVKANYNSLSDTLLTYGSEEDIGFSFSEGITLSDSLTFKGKTTIEINEEITFSDLTSIEDFYFTVNEGITLEDYDNLELTISNLYPTDLRTLVRKSYKYLTYLATSLLSFKKYATKLYTKLLTHKSYATDLRVRYDDYDSINIGTLDDFRIYLDGNELLDVDFDTLSISYTLNSTPSSASFILARRHDNYDYTLNNVYSQISNENKITIYDDTTLLFTGYITEISALSSTDTIQILAEDARYKISRISLNLWYGGKYEGKESNPEIQERFEKNIGEAIQEVLIAIDGIISGYDTVPFTTSHVPEYNESYSDCANFLDILINQTANTNWYLDVNERIRYQMLDSGTIKTIPLSSLNSHRHAYDVIISDVILNKQKSGYAKSFNVEFGDKISQRVSLTTLSATESHNYSDISGEKTWFGFQDLVNGSGERYIGISPTLYTYFLFGSGGGWVLKAWWVLQIIKSVVTSKITPITIGSGLPVKTLYMTSYSISDIDDRREERSKPNDTDTTPYYCAVSSEKFNHIDYALDLANFELAQNNKLQTSARVSLLLDAYKYYGLNFINRINLSNTINPTIYKNNNGFPLNIKQIDINCSNRTVMLALNNEGKSWAVKTTNYLTNYRPSEVRYLQKKQPVIKIGQ